jgi:hypothetical protein
VQGASAAAAPHPTPAPHPGAFASVGEGAAQQPEAETAPPGENPPEVEALETESEEAELPPSEEALASVTRTRVAP